MVLFVGFDHMHSINFCLNTKDEKHKNASFTFGVEEKKRLNAILSIERCT